MKRLLLIVLPLLLIVGCSSPEPINYQETLNKRDDVYYTKDTNQPYSGPVFSLDKNGRNKRESILENGKMITYKDFEYYKNGQKRLEGTYKDGKPDGLQTWWFENGQKKLEGNFKDGNTDGLVTEWYDNGQKEEERLYKDGKEIERLRWNYYENGQKWMEGTLKNGKRDGLETTWYENGQKYRERTYKDGKEISKKEWNEDGSVKE